jgi:outer membrane receptor protein involved in Fe transport
MNRVSLERSVARLLPLGASIIALAHANVALAQAVPTSSSRNATSAAAPKSRGAASSAGGGDARAPGTDAADPASDQELVITGSRIVSLGTNSPTPLTVVSVEQLQQTTPTNIPEGLNKLPIFQGSTQPRRSGDGNGNQAQNVLNLRGFGAPRTLVLLDGRRVAPSNANGTVDIGTVPQLLLQRVDVVTGGASAVYGSDAVTGVVNFVIDKKFSGLKLDANTGISDYGDAPSYRIGIAGGTDLFGGRGHIIASFQHRQIGSVDNFDRPYGKGVYVLTGSGTASNPFVETMNTRRADSTFGGKIVTCTATCSVAGQQFIANGVIGPFVPGQTTGTANQNSGGDGAYTMFTTALVKQRTDEGYARFGYEVTDSINFFAQGQYAEAYSSGFHFPAKLTPGNGQASTFYKNNAFLSATNRAFLGDNGRSDATNTFQLGTYIVNTGPKGLPGTENLNRYAAGTAGFDGTLAGLRWEVYYTHGDNELTVDNLNNSNYQKQFAALDAVAGPNGTAQCYAATQAATAAAYAGCVPLNAFGPTAITQNAFSWFTATTTQKVRNKLDDLAGSITGKAFDNWAGPVNFALSGEARWNKYAVTSNASPTATVDCTGLRICNPALPLWAQPVSAELAAKNNVWEIAGELAIPLLRDVKFFDSVDLNLAGRHTDYSTSGKVNTWKIGLDWRINSTIRLRGTTSRDIRAPTLNDLFQPVQGSVSGFIDTHTSVSNTLFIYSQGNPALKPEVSRTYTGGLVVTPQFLPGFDASIDYYKIRMSNAIGAIAAANSTVQRICEDSNGTSVYCQLYDRPLPFSDRSAANFPTRVFNLSLNTALTQIEGVDVELNYRFQALGGRMTARLFANYQPTNESVPFTGAPTTRATASKTRLTGFLSYEADHFNLGLQDRWLSKFSRVATNGQVYQDPTVNAFNTLDLNVEYKFDWFGPKSSVYFTVQNVLNAKPEITPLGGSVGIEYPVPAGYDIMGRYFTVGLRTRF